MTVRFSDRTNWQPASNRLAEARDEWAARSLPLLDLTESNPTRVGLNLPLDEVGARIGHAVSARYDPDPRGLLSAREALAEALSREGPPVSADDLILTASTSEAYGYLFKLFGNPGDEVVTGVPMYPLLDHLARLESLELSHFRFEYQGSWTLDDESVRAALGEKSKALIVVHPNNPTGAYLTTDGQHYLGGICASRGIPFISDEVFFDYPLSPPRNRAGSAASLTEGITLSLGGLSKSAGLPHLKLGWIQVGGSATDRRRTIEALELISDQYLSVSTPVQLALPFLLELAPSIRRTITARLMANLTKLREKTAGAAPLQLLSVEGGWTAILRFPAIISDEDLAVGLLKKTGVLVHPGYFFDFPGEGFLAVSLLCSTETFDEGIDHLLRYVHEITH